MESKKSSRGGASAPPEGIYPEICRELVPRSRMTLQNLRSNRTVALTYYFNQPTNEIRKKEKKNKMTERKIKRKRKQKTRKGNKEGRKEKDVKEEKEKKEWWEKEEKEDTVE
ncbi:hypothetical protein M0804_007882 [Polistes exclamans]|nr:hypothetical protein M0804_007882 [Polistes exclamans]